MRFKKGFLVLLLLLIAFAVLKFLLYSGPSSFIKKAKVKSFTLNIPRDLNFSGDTVPVDNLKIRALLDSELVNFSYENAQNLLLHKRANQWFKVIAPILKRYQIPDDFKYLALAESKLVNVVSKKGAAGFWQFIPETGKKYGLIINDEVDERYHAEKATEAACRFFKESFRALGNWTLVAASYNMGITGLIKQIKLQKKENYYALNLNKETGAFVYKILVLKEIISHPAQYGYEFKKSELFPPIPMQNLEVDTPLQNLKQVAVKLNYDYTTFKYFNPWLITDHLVKIEGRCFKIQLPKSPIQQSQLVKRLIFQDSLARSSRDNHLPNTDIPIKE